MEKENTTIKKRAYSFLIPIFFLSLFLACLIISIGNDMFAFFKPKAEAVIEINSHCSLKELSHILEENDIISNPLVFSLYVKNNGAEDRVTEFTGRIELTSDMSYRELVQCFADKTQQK